jgi:hypothetical protein
MQDGVDGIVRHECRFLRSDGGVVWVMVSTSRVPATVDRSAHLIMHIEDVTDRKHLEAELHHRALHDPLTGLANRALLAQRIREAQARYRRHARPSMWVPRTESPHAACRYSWTRPLSRSRRCTRMAAPERGRVPPMGGRWFRDRCGRWVLKCWTYSRRTMSR